MMRRALALIIVGMLVLGSISATAAPLEHSFESGNAGQSYGLNDWAMSDWNSPWMLGDERSQIDDEISHYGYKSLRIFYPKGEFGPENSGYLAPFQLESADEYYLSFWARFSEEFSWGGARSEGKLGIGLAGGASCSGGQTCTGDNGFSSRLIWRENGQAALYYYSMDKTGPYGDKAYLINSDGSPVYYPRGEWFNIVQRLKVNTVTNGQANADGEIEIWYNGQAAAKVSGLRFVSNTDKVDKAYFASFYGGGTADYAPSRDSYIWYDDIKVSSLRSDICELDQEGCDDTYFMQPWLAGTPLHWAKGALQRAFELHIWDGPEDGPSFNPDAPVNRAVFVQMLVRALGIDRQAETAPFRDIQGLDKAQQQAIAAALAAGIANGFEDGSFRPQGEVTRAQLAVMLARALKLPSGNPPSAPLFSDDKRLPAWARDSVYALSEQGVIHGRSGHEFNPSAPATFAEAVVALLRAADLSAKPM